MNSSSKNKTINLKKSTKRKDLRESSSAAPQPTNSNLMIIAEKTDFYKILKETHDRLLVIEFFADWCGPCQILAGKLEQLAQAYNGKILIVKVDVDEFEELAAEYDISAMPTFMLMKNQQKLLQFSSSDEKTLDKNLEKYAGKPEIRAEGDDVKHGGKVNESK